MTTIRQKTENYIVKHIDGEGYGVTLKTRKQKLSFLYNTFKKEYGYMINRVGEQQALREWYQGLPSAINLVFYNSDIIELAEKWGSLSKNATEKQQDRIVNNYFYYMAYNTMRLFKKNGIVA